MNREDVKKTLFLLETSYPVYYKNMSVSDKGKQVELYLEMLGEYNVATVVQALKNYIRKNQYPPTIAGLIEPIELLNTNECTDTDLWNSVVKAVRNSGYNSVSEFEKLPEECKQWLGSPATLKELALSDITTLNTVTRGQFLKTIKIIKDRKKALQGIENKDSSCIEYLKSLKEGEKIEKI